MSKPKPTKLKDPRLHRRLAQMTARALEDLGAGFPEMMGTEAELEAAYRFFDNDAVSPEAILAPHVQESIESAAKLGRVLVLHDSSWLVFGGESVRKGLGRVGKGKKHDGFLGHFGLGVSRDGQRLPLGLFGLSTMAFDKPVVKKTQKQTLADPERKSLRWGALIIKVENLLAPRGIEVTHVGDRETDDYGLFEELVEADIQFVFRLRYDRTVCEAPGMKESLRALMKRHVHQVEREVPLSPRGSDRAPVDLEVYPPREQRLARLQIRAVAVDLPRPRSRKSDCKAPSLRLNMVQVLEVDPPSGEAPVEWLLVTNEPIDTSEQIESVVDAYRTRWVIEEYFKALKTGCAMEERQLETRARLENALAFLAPVAVSLLRLRNLARDAPERPASAALTETQLALLAQLARKPLPESPTVVEAMYAIAALGGHLKRNGRPGWRTLHRGFQKLTDAEAGWRAALAPRARTERRVRAL